MEIGLTNICCYYSDPHILIALGTAGQKILNWLYNTRVRPLKLYAKSLLSGRLE
jgi:hypothetical protein